ITTYKLLTINLYEQLYYIIRFIYCQSFLYSFTKRNDWLQGFQVKKRVLTSMIAPSIHLPIPLSMRKSPDVSGLNKENKM
ncbi:hypothetical protein MMJ63_24915, partial [Bacillus vallismortis]|nr:hypothetical protein [Bacillus vallismortis]